MNPKVVPRLKKRHQTTLTLKIVLTSVILLSCLCTLTFVVICTSDNKFKAPKQTRYIASKTVFVDTLGPMSEFKTTNIPVKTKLNLANTGVDSLTENRIIRNDSSTPKVADLGTQRPLPESEETNYLIKKKLNLATIESDLLTEKHIIRNVSSTPKVADLGTQRPLPESEETNYLIKKKLNLATIESDLLTEKHIIRNVSSTPKVADLGTQRPLPESEETNYLIKKKLNLATIESDLLTEKHIIRNVSSTPKVADLGTQRPLPESEETNYLIKKKLNLATIESDLLTEKHIIRNVSSTPKVADLGTPKPIYPVTLEAKYILENPNLCNDVKNLSLLIYIHSAPNHFSRRQYIRNTYANASLFRPFGIIRVLFLLGTVNDLIVQEHIAEEFHKYSDTCILQGDFIDAYANLTLKGVMAYKWINDKCRNADFVLKTDDDVVINMYKLLTEYLPAFKEKSKTILCNHILKGTMPITRDKKLRWYIKDSEFRGQTHYPQYCSGFFVIITNDVIPAIYRSAHLTPFF